MAQHSADAARPSTKSRTKQTVTSTKPSPPQLADAQESLSSEYELFEDISQPDILKDPRMDNPSAQQLRVRTVHMLQHAGGNAAVQRMMQARHTPVSGLIQRQPEGAEKDNTSLVERNKAIAFMSKGVYGPKTSQGAHDIGGFEATYIAPAILKITVKGGIKFIDGLRVEGGNVVPGNPGIQNTADMVSGLSPAERAFFLSEYQWKPEEKAPFLKKLISVVQQTWNSSATGLSFFINKPEWEWLKAFVIIDVQLRIIGQDESRAADDHLVVNAIKEQAGMSETESELRMWDVDKHTRDPDSAFDQEIDISSSNVDPREDNNLTELGTVYFDVNSSELSPNAKSQLDGWVATFQGKPDNPASALCPVHINGYTSASGTTEDNMELAKNRVAAVRDYIIKKGFTRTSSRITQKAVGETGAMQDIEEKHAGFDRRVEIIVGTGKGQIVAAHEFGHAFGLGDEYASGGGSLVGSHAGSGRLAGTEAHHHDLTTSMTDEQGRNLPGAIHENTDHIMAMGNVVKPQHYSTFHNALVQVTGVQEWSVKS